VPAFGAGRNQDGDRLGVVGRVAGARVEQVGIALAVDFEEALVVAGGADRLAVGESDRRQRSGLARVLDADAPLPAFLAAQSHDVAADVDQRIADPLAAQDGRGPVEGDPFQVAAEIERDLRGCCWDGVAV
jgi:hypothetical protein